MAALLRMPASLKIPDFLRDPFRSTHILVVAVLLFAAVLGLLTPLLVEVTGGQISKVLALPAVMLFAIMLLYDRKLSLLIIIFLRSSGDNVLGLTRYSIAGIPLGIGGLINASVILIALLLVFEKPKRVPASAFSAWVPFLILMAYGVLIAPGSVRSDAIRLYLSLLSYFAMFIAGYHCVSDKMEFRKIMRLIVWSSLVPVLYSAVDVALNHSVADFRLRSTFNHPNVLAFYITVVISMTFYLFKSLPAKAPGHHKVFLALYLIVLLGVLALTKTRSAWAATAISFGIYALLFERRYLIYIFMLGAAGMLVPGVLDRLTELGQGNTVGTYATLNSFAWRVYLWQTALEWASPTSYLLGNGLLSFKEYSVIFFPLAGKINFGAHSVYVQILFELGVAGLAAFCWLYFRVLKELKKLIKIDKLAAFSLIVVVVNFLICCFSDNMLDYLAYAWYLWFAVGAGCALVRNNNTGV